MLTKQLIWAGELALFLLAALSAFMPFGQSIRIVAILYFILYLPGYFFLKNLYFSENALEQNTLSLILGIVLNAEAAYLLRLLAVPYTKTTALTCAGAIIGASLLWEQAQQRKTRGASKRRK
jgi:uncharacterized membrane protein